ncbi:MAG: hypothetical protein XD78_2246 [Desulfotomaculum sp. 46_296]|nr:MAG: hypothetical protein XD78_2246 [Desulfotomaculum sp. 46_296]
MFFCFHFWGLYEVSFVKKTHRKNSERKEILVLQTWFKESTMARKERVNIKPGIRVILTAYI